MSKHISTKAAQDAAYADMKKAKINFSLVKQQKKILLLPKESIIPLNI